MDSKQSPDVVDNSVKPKTANSEWLATNYGSPFPLTRKMMPGGRAAQP
jgi:hypothetical protein